MEENSFKQSNNFLTLLLSSALLFLISIFISLPQAPKDNKKEVAAQPYSMGEVLGKNTDAPYIYISGTSEGYGSGGMISIASTDESSVDISSYNFSGRAKFDLYPG